MEFRESPISICAIYTVHIMAKSYTIKAGDTDTWKKIYVKWNMAKQFIGISILIKT